MNTVAAPLALPREQQNRLKAEQVRYLVFEGGGGKGFAYLGAMQVLESLNVLQYSVDDWDRKRLVGPIRGVGGASAGAITALLLSIGYDSSDTRRFLSETNFDTFFDSPAIRSRPVVGGVRLVTSDGNVADDTPDERRWLEILPLLPIERLVRLLLSLRALKGARMELERRGRKPPLSLLRQHWQKYVVYMGRDMGVFHGGEARKTFDRLIGESVRGRAPVRPPRNLTFEQHFEEFKTKLLVTGSNLSTGKTEIFSKDDTPDFPVADAVRISMSLPFIYKPYVLERDTYHGRPPCGTYVDGGVWNNLPFREFDAEPGDDPPLDGSSSRPRAKTLGLRLEITPAVRVRNFADLLKQVALFGLFGSGESQVLAKYVDQTILLDTRGLDLVDFSPPAADRDRAIKRAKRATWRYFGFDVPAGDADPADDAETETLRRGTGACD